MTGPAGTTSPVTPLRVLQVVVGLGLATAMLVWGLPLLAKTTWSEVFDALAMVSWWTSLGCLGLVLAGLYCYTFVMTGAMPGLGHTRALVLNVCGSSVSNLLPGGGAVGLAATYSIARSWGFDLARVTTMAVVTGVWNVLARVVLPVIAVAGLSLGADDLPASMRDAAWAAIGSGLVIVVVATLATVSDRGAHVVGGLVDRGVRVFRAGHTDGATRALVRLRRQTAETVRTGWLPMTLGMAGFFGIYYLLFVLCTGVTGVDLSQGQLFAAYALGRLLTAVGVTPGGLGVTEAGTTAALVAWGADPASALAGVVIFSIFSHLMEVPLGALGWLAWSVMPRASEREVARVES